MSFVRSESLYLYLQISLRIDAEQKKYFPSPKSTRPEDCPEDYPRDEQGNGNVKIILRTVQRTLETG